MTKFETNLWNFLSQMTVSDDLSQMTVDNFDLVARLNMAINLAEEVQKMSGFGIEKTVHRDLKPTNIMLDATRSLILIDVGIGRTYNPANDTSSWGSCGTVGFLAPEQLTCYKQSDKVDIWALGKVIALIIFQWKFAWHLLWSPKFLPLDEIRSLGPLVKLIDLLRDMIQVSELYKLCS